MLERFTALQAIERHPLLAFFARRPVTVCVLLTATTVIGLIGMQLMPLELFPSGLESRTISVTVPYSRADAVSTPLSVERTITLPVEAELSTIPGIENLTAVSSRTGARFDIEFSGKQDMTEAYAQVTDAVERARLRLPSDTGRIQVRKSGMGGGGAGAFPIGFISFFWEDDVQDPQLKLENIVQTRLESVDGVSGVTFFGVTRKFIAVDIDREKAGAYGVNLAELMSRLRQDNVREPAGKVREEGKDIYLVADSRLKSVEQMRSLPVRPGLKLSEIAEVYETESIDSYVRVNGRWGATCMLFKSSDSNTVQVCDRVNEALVELAHDSRLAGFQTRVPWMQGDSIKESIANLMSTLLWGALFAVIVLLVFLKSFRFSLVIALSIPLSMAMTLAVMYFMGETINILSLMGFTLAAGMLLDNAIVVAENVFRRGQLGDEPLGASIRGAGEIGLALVLSTSTTIIVFVGVIYLSGADFIRFVMSRIGIPVCVGLALSVLVALGVIPMAMHRFGMIGERKPSRFRAWFIGLRLRITLALPAAPAGRKAALWGALALWEGASAFVGRQAGGTPKAPVIDAVAAFYERSLRVLARQRYWVTVLVLGATFAGIPALYSALQQTDQNQGNRDRIELRINFPPSAVIKYEALDDKGQPVIRRDELWKTYTLEELERTLWGLPRVERVTVEEVLALLASRGNTSPTNDEFMEAVSELRKAREPSEQVKQEARAVAFEKFGIEAMSISFSSRNARVSLFLDRKRLDQGNEFYKRIMAAIPERAGVELRGEFQGGSASSSEVSVLVKGPDSERLLEIAQDISRRMEGVRGVEGVRVDAEAGTDEVTLQLERERATAMNVSPDMLAQVLAFNLGGTALRDYQKGDNLIPLRVRFAPPRDARGNPRDPEIDDVGEIRVPGASGGAVAAKAVTSTSGLAKPGLGEVRRLNRQTTLRVVATTSTEDLDRIRADVNEQIAGVRFPPGYSREFSGRFASFARTSGDMFAALGWSMVMVLLLMCFLFESFIKPVCILVVSVPGAILGGWGMLLATGTPNDSLSWLGLMILVGVVVNNGIVQVDLINRLRQDGIERNAAVIEGCTQRIRPILMTTLTTVFGLIPMAIGDATFVGTPYYPMGRMVLGGMIASMFYTLLFVPLLYLILDDAGLAVKGWAGTLFGSRRGGAPAVAVARSPE